MKITKQARRDARQLLRVCVVNNALDENRARQAATLLVKDKPRGYAGVLSQFYRLVRLELARRTARVESATPLSAQLQSEVQADLTRKYGGGLTFNFVHNPALLGGLRIQVGGDVYNGSIQGRLAALQESL
ncbi:MAG TPA: F0F1 ATP synthase subunit delta [Candidatus Saccharimonadales bacterium]|nr:F0F1 ATP synthase subunit delta [Candidatus Saccharimonadales bacterium]